MNHRVLITGSSGLIGSALVPLLVNCGNQVRLLDVSITGEGAGDTRDRDSVHSAIAGCDGIIHLAAVSRVIWGEHKPDLCWATNVGGLRNVLESASTSSKKPWVIFASSREIYGQPDRLPATEECRANPVNIYGRSKVAGEMLVETARREGLRACTIRLSNVFGSVHDHADRVVPAFARAAAQGSPLRVDGAEHTFDFTHTDDVAAGIATLTALLGEGGTRHRRSTSSAGCPQP
ncbi:MAG: NAD(P)-dependent oxidoreductase [bacterium]